MQTLAARFERQASQHAARLAVKTEMGNLTYRNLNNAANRIAHAVLRSRGDDREPVVILTACDEKLVLATLGVLKAGHICVPLSAQAPQQLAQLLEQSSARLVVTDRANYSLAVRISGTRHILDIDGMAGAGAADDPDLEIAADEPAYILFTSGSSGPAKGVVHSHRSMLHIVLDNTNSQRIGPDDRVALLSSNGFIGSPATIFRALLNGAALLPFDLHRKTIQDLGPWLEAEDITLVQTVPSVFRSLVGTLPRKAGFPRLRILHLAGEPVTRRDVTLFKHCFATTTTLLNELGATEAGALRRFFVDQSCRLRDDVIPAGYPVEDKEILILDQHGAQVGGSEIGEIAVRSRYLAQGYWRQRELTETAFSRDVHEDGARTYRTGDLGRMRPDGCLELVGRKDSVIKVRGHPVDVTAIEAVLRAQEGVEGAVVVGREDAMGNTALVAYVVPRAPGAISTEALRRGLRTTLPPLQIPSRFVPLAALPRTPTGKVDRQALPAVPDWRPTLDMPFVAPRSHLERTLGRIWAEVLEIERIGLHDNFFDLGGHSLSATLIVARVGDRFRIDLATRTLFDAPTLAAFSERVSDARRIPDAAALEIVQRDAEDDAHDLSYAQQRLWFLEQLHGPGFAAHVPVAVRLKGQLQRDVLKRALGAIVARHDILRSSFPTQEGRPRQIVAPRLSVELRETDLRALSNWDQRRALQDRVRKAKRHAADLSQAPLWHVDLLQLSSRDHVLLWSLHHMLCDGWSVGVLLRELATFYRAISAGRPPPLEPLAMQYADFVRWQHQAIKNDDFLRQRLYWQEQLRDMPLRLDLPTDYPRKGRRSSTSARLPLHLPALLTGALKALSRDESCSPFMTLVAAFKVLLYRYSEQRDICIGTIIANRNRVESEPLIGCFINNLILRTQLPEGANFRDVLRRVKEVTLDGYANQDVPFEVLLEALRIDRSMPRRPLFQVMLVLQNLPLPASSMDDLTIELEPDGEDGQSDCDLTLWIAEHDGALSGSIEYDASLFHETTIKRLEGHFQTLLESIVARPEQDIDTLSMSSAGERKRMAFAASGSAPAIRQPASVVARFEKQAELAPDSTALVAGPRTLTYGELNRRANRLARDLRARGVGPETCVGLYIRRCPEMVVGLLAILKAGGAFVPMDPTYPEERLRYMLSETGAPIVLTQADLTTRLPGYAGAVVCLDEASTPTPANSADPPHAHAPDRLACIIYTSGSTGRPKGVQLTHGALACATETLCEAFEPSRSDRVLQFAALSYSTSLEEIFPCLVSGATLVLRDEAMIDSVFGFIEACQDLRVSVLDLPTSYWHVLAASLVRYDLELPSSVRLVIIGGQPALHERLVDWQARVDSSVRLVNTYGPTEASVVATMCELADRAQPPSSMPYCPIGHAVGHVEAYVLDKQLQTVPAGVAGELYLGGGGLARGYLNRPDETAEAFIPHPFSEAPGARLYRTRDRVRYRGEGDLEYLGRTDHQINLRGFRIEPGEIETVLTGHSAIEEAVVVLAGNDAAAEAPLGPRLLAYLVARDGAEVSTIDIRAALRRELPDYMVPAHFVVLEAMPRTVEGKIDSEVLPEPDLSRPALESEFVVPRTPTEQILAEIWAEVLGLDKIGIHDDFFDLGGHSLLAVRLVSKIEAKLGQSIPLVELFQGRTIEHFARIVGEEHSGESSSAIVAIQPNGSTPPFFAGGSHPKYVDVARRLGRDQTFYRLDVYGLQSDRLAEGQKMCGRIEDMAARFIEELRAVQPVGPYFLGGGCEGGIVAFEMALQLQRQGEQIACLVIWGMEAPGHYSGRYGRRPLFIRAAYHLLSLLRGAVSLRELVVFIKHENIDYRIFRAVDHYVPSERYRGKLTLVRTVEHGPSDSEDLSAGWTELGTKGAEVHVMPGIHEAMFDTYVDEFSSLLESFLVAARSG
jgi:amino acid adenylation domain-containing protein